MESLTKIDNIFYNTIKKRINFDYDDYSIFINSIAILGLLWLIVIAVYIFPIGLDKLIISLLLFLFWYSKSNYFWYAFFIILILTPGGFFTETSGEATRRLPLFNVMPKVSFSVFDLFLIVSFLKAIFKGRKMKLKDSLNLKYGIIFLVYFIIVSIFQGVTLKTFMSFPLRGLFFYTFFYSFPALVFTRNDTYKFMFMFFPFVFNEVLTQLYLLTTGQYLLSAFYGGAYDVVVKDKLMGDTIRAIANGYTIIVLSFMFCMVLLTNAKSKIIRNYILVVMMFCFLSIIFSATRQTIIMFAFMFVIYFVFVNKAKPGFLIQLFIIILVFFFLLDTLNIMNLNVIFGASFNRFAGAFQFSGGSLEAEDTLDYRLTYRLPLILVHIQRSLFLGFGFSNQFFEYYDGHLGGVLAGIIQLGLIGYLSLIGFVVYIFKLSLKYAQKLGDNNSCSAVIKSLLVGVSGYFLVNIFIDPVILINVWAKPHEFFILLVLISQFIKFGKIEYYYKNYILRREFIRRQSSLQSG